MSAANRERKIVAAIACPQCGAVKGRPCSVRAGRPLVCRERREAWQAWREARPADLVVSGFGVEGEERRQFLVIRAATPAARRWLFNLPIGTWKHGALEVVPSELTRLTMAAAEAGLKVGGVDRG
jgi:hypothetical protein